MNILLELILYLYLAINAFIYIGVFCYNKLNEISYSKPLDTASEFFLIIIFGLPLIICGYLSKVREGRKVDEL